MGGPISNVPYGWPLSVIGVFFVQTRILVYAFRVCEVGEEMKKPQEINKLIN